MQPSLVSAAQDLPTNTRKKKTTQSGSKGKVEIYHFILLLWLFCVAEQQQQKVHSFCKKYLQSH